MQPGSHCRTGSPAFSLVSNVTRLAAELYVQICKKSPSSALSDQSSLYCIFKQMNMQQRMCFNGKVFFFFKFAFLTFFFDIYFDIRNWTENFTFS